MRAAPFPQQRRFIHAVWESSAVVYSPRSPSKIQPRAQANDPIMRSPTLRTKRVRLAPEYGITIYVRTPYVVRLRTSTGELARRSARVNSGR